jgi:DNA-binding beta-propeller fold protein YncE
MFITMWGDPGQLESPEILAINSATGNVYVAGSESGYIQKFTPDGKFITRFTMLGSRDNVTGNLVGVGDVAVDSASGNVYVADSSNDRIQKFTSNGKFITMWKCCR